MIARISIIALLALTVAAPLSHAGGERCAVAEGKDVDLVICLDTSGSMSGLINAARQKLWVVVNDLATAQPTPRLRVALLTFGNDGLDPAAGWVGVETDLTDDLDLVSQQLFALSTNGGTEYVGRVLNRSSQLDWSQNPDALQLVIVAGNESADQDQEVPFREACEALIARGIMVNAVYCGTAEDNIAPSWREVARLADGRFASIDHNNGTVVIETPFDLELSQLSGSLNSTFVFYGKKAKEVSLNQVEQDKNAASMSPATAADRAQTKASKLYKPTDDLVDALAEGEVELKDIDAKDLPEPMKAMTDKEREAFLAKKAKEREALQKQIAELAAKRDAFIKAELERRATDASQSLDHALRQAIREQAEAKGFRFETAAAN